ncbi:uncharacterized protein hhla2b.1 [Misgurnus anguillicaudatus]|uniref:uncharacterized protein hhla2b.1 n=1 Tax=Misgurnus anguillicaudatus TaxID=75329 RepID=UPI003CCF5B8E
MRYLSLRRCTLVKNVQSYILTVSSSDLQVTCIFSQDCVLPCHFEPVGDEIIYWYRQSVLIYTYRQGSGLLDQSTHLYTGRISLFNGTINFGNASLHIQKCGQQDKGKYKCLVASGQNKNEHFIIVKVEAPIKSVNMETTCLSGYEEVKCSARNVYPAPRITLYTEPPVLPDGLPPNTRKKADRDGLYAVESKIRKLEDKADLTYICLVQSFYMSQLWRTSLQEKEIYSVEGQDFIIPCVALWDLENFTVTWSFTKEYNTSIIYTYDSITHLSSNVWKEKVRLVSPRGQIGDGSLQIRNPLRLEHAGIYTCVLSALQTKHEVRTTVNIVARTAKTQPKSSPQWIPPALISCLVLAVIIAGIVIVKRKVCKPRSTQTYGEVTDIHPMRDSQISLRCNVTNANSGEPSESTCLSEGMANRNT